ncbi:MAG: mandelate racemase/muconate lactonizing enzyme family protein [Candidatus Latescibacterota bacterium]
MKITQVDLYEVEIPPIPPIARYFPKIYDITLCRIRTDEGLQGWGEYQGTKSVHQQKAAALVGEDPLALDPFVQPDAFSCALLDIAGQAYGLPLHRFFGAQVREKVPVSYWSCHMEPHETAAEAEVGARLGFSNHKLKARSWDIVETVRLMKEAAGPEYTVGVDPNTEFGLLPAAARLAAELEPLGTVVVFEDPMLKNNLEWYRMLREKTHIPIALHLGAPAGVLAALKAECIDYANLGGSALQVRKAAALAEAADVPCWVQMGGLCTGVLAAYSVHLQATLPNATLPCDELPFTRETDVLDGGLRLESGHFDVPSGPGLGVQVNMEVVERYRVA